MAIVGTVMVVQVGEAGVLEEEVAVGGAACGGGAVWFSVALALGYKKRIKGCWDGEETKESAKNVMANSR